MKRIAQFRYYIFLQVSIKGYETSSGAQVINGTLVCNNINQYQMTPQIFREKTDDVLKKEILAFVKKYSENLIPIEIVSEQKPTKDIAPIPTPKDKEIIVPKFVPPEEKLDTLQIIYPTTLIIQSNIPGAIAKIDGKDKPGETSNTGILFINNIAPGSHTITLTKENYVPRNEEVTIEENKIVTARINLHLLDKIPPEIQIISPPLRGIKAIVNNDTTTIIGLARDDSKIAIVTINGIKAELSKPDENELNMLPGNTIKFSLDVKVAAGINTIKIQAIDEAGNQAQIEHILEYVPSPPPPIGSFHWALVVGISNYHDTLIPSLRYAARDAQSFYDWLISPDGGRYSPANIELLLNENATLQNIKDKLNIWLQQALEEDMVTLYFAGHGSPQNPGDTENLYFLPYDTDYARIASTGFPMWDFETALKRFIKAKKIIIISDACHSGGVGQPFDVARRAGKEILINQINTSFQNLRNIRDGVCVISASAENQFSQEGQQWGGGHGVFTYFLLEGLKGDADYTKDNRVTLGELNSYISETVRRETKNSQSPIIAGKYDPALSIAR